MSYWLLEYLHIDNPYRLGTVVNSMVNKHTSHFIQMKVSYVASDYRAFTKDLYSDGCLHNNTLKEKIIGARHSKIWDLGEKLKLYHTMLHTKHKVKQGLISVVALQLFT